MTAVLESDAGLWERTRAARRGLLAGTPEFTGGRPACAPPRPGDPITAARIHPETFHPLTDASPGEAAKAVCRRCPVISDCLAWALEHGEKGVWGGMTAGERRRLRRGRYEAARKAAAAPVEVAS